MINQYYTVEGKQVRLVNFRIYDDNQYVRLFFDLRNYDISFDDMPEAMRHWIPTEGEFVTTYDHISAESGLKPAEDNLSVIVNNSNTGVAQLKDPTPREVLTTMFIDRMPQDLLDIGKIVEYANNVIMNLKDPKSGVNGQAYINQANAIAGLLDKVIKAKKLTIDEYNLALKIIGQQDHEFPPIEGKKKGDH